MSAKTLGSKRAWTLGSVPAKTLGSEEEWTSSSASKDAEPRMRVDIG